MSRPDLVAMACVTTIQGVNWRKEVAENVDAELQPLRLPGGWEVRWNSFFDIEPDALSRDRFLMLFDEDMLLLRSNDGRIIIDLGWYGEQDDGRYRLDATPCSESGDQDWRNLLRTFSSRSKAEIVATLEQWVLDLPSPSRGRR